MPKVFSVKDVAKICHEANKQLCANLGDDSQKSWDDAEQWQVDSAINGVKFTLDNPDAPPSSNHDSWMKEKTGDGWVWGETKDAEAKTHPCIVPYENLPPEQRAKDHLFRSIVEGLEPFINRDSK